MTKIERNQSVTIAEVSGNDLLVPRLRELGFITGEIIRVHGAALFGDPIFVEVRGTLVALRREEAKCVRVR